MKYLSVCAGIEAASVAWHPLGWEAVGYSEIEPFPSAVLKHHYPEVTNFGDMTKYKEWNLDSIDLLVGGTPCQSFSVAGLRKGLADPRGNLALVYCGILDHFRPQWFVWENVPGVLSSNGGRDFGSFLGALAELGYGFAYRVLDAQYFGVAQRRRRVFVVGYLGDWRPAAEVLFERESVRGDSAPSREKRQEVAGTFTARAKSGGWGHDVNLAAGGYMQPVAKCIITKTRHDAETETLIPTYAIQGSMIGRNDNAGPQGDGINEEVCFTQNTTDRHAVAQPIVAAFKGGQGSGAGSIGYSEHIAPTLSSSEGGNRTPTVFISQPMYMGNAEGGAKEVPFLTCHNLGGTAGISNQTPLIGQPITFSGQMSVPQTDVDMSATLQAKNPMAVAFTCSEQSNSFAWERPFSPTITAQQPSDTSNIQTGVRIGMAVRRLTPVECERLQGFPDNYTNIPWRKAVESPDGPRYKALGNSMAVPVMAWIGQRIANYEQQA